MRLTSTTGFRAAIGAVSAALLVVLATPTPAFAGNISVSAGAVTVGEQPGSTSVSVMGADIGASRNVRVSVSMSGEAAGFVNVKLSSGKCKANGTTANCGKLKPGESKDFTVEVSLKPDSGLQAGDQKTGSLDFKVAGPNRGAGNAPVTVTGFTQVATAIGGTVTDLDGKPLSGASFKADDGAGTTFGPVKTGDDGKFSVDAEVEPDTVLHWEISKDGFKTAKDDYTVVAGQPISIETRLDEKSSNKSEAPKNQENNSADNSGEEDSGFTFTTWVLIILGILLAIGGIFAIWMLLRRGKDDEEEEKNLPHEPPTHQLSASQTGKLGIYEGSGMRVGADNPTMIHSGPLLNDDDLARYGSEPASGGGFGPAYSDAQSTRAVPSPNDIPPAGATQRYGAAEPPSGGWQSNEPVSGGWQSNQPVSGSTQRYPAAEPGSGSWRAGEPASGNWQSNQPVSGSSQRYGAEPASGGWRSDQPASGSTQRYPAAEPGSGSWGSGEPASGNWQSNQPVSGSSQRYGTEPASGGWRSDQPASGSTQRYPAAEPGSGSWGSGDSYGDRGSQYDDRGRGYRENDSYGEQQPWQSSGRRYRDDDYGDYDDRPRSW